MALQDPGPSLLVLPDTCLVTVLQYVAVDDHKSVFSAARAHSRLRQAAIAVATAQRSIKVGVRQQQQVDSMLLYLAKYGQNINNIDFRALQLVSIYQLPSNLRLSSLQCDGFELQLQPGGCFQGVLGDAARLAALKQLRLSGCRVLDVRAHAGLAAAFSNLPTGLEHLSIDGIMVVKAVTL